MRAISNRFLRSLSGSFPMTARAYVVAPGQEGTAPTGVEIPIIDGEVSLDSTADIRSWLTMTTDGFKQWPTASTDSFTPYGNEVFLQMGFNFGAGSYEWVSLGYFRINSIGQTDHPNHPIFITAQDRMSSIVDSRLTSPIQFSATDTFGEVMEQLVLDIYPAATIEWDDSTDTDPIGRTLIAEEERFAFLNDLVTSVGKIWFWDYRGVLVIKDPPAEDEPVWTVSSTDILFSLSREQSREGVYNGVVAYGEALDDIAPSRFVAVDNNPDSPTYWYGAFGKVVRKYSSPFITTNAQAESAAKSMLKQALGLPYNVDFATVLNPALEPLDPVLVTFQNREEIHIIEKLRIPFGESPEQMTATTREQTLVEIGEE